METIGSYRILSQIGAGGMGAVFLAEHRFLKRRAAIKMLLADLATRPDVLERFFAEARATSQLEHPGIVRIFDCEVDAQGRPYFVMEYIEGETLGAHLRRRGRLPFAEAAGFATALAEALGAAHDRGIVHRDLKPDNVFVRPGPRPAIKLVDFGIAKLAEEFRAVAGSRTQTGTLLGTPPYMSPEQCRGAGTVDHRTDVYSLGCVLFEMLCGQPPFVRDSTGAFLIAHITETPPRAQTLAPAVPAALGEVIARLLAKAPEARPQTMHEVIEALAPFVEAPPVTLAPATSATPLLPVAAPPAAPAPTTIPAAAPTAMPAPGPAPAPGRVAAPISIADVAAASPEPGATIPKTTLQSNAGELIDGRVARALAEAEGTVAPGRNRAVLLGGLALSLVVVGLIAWKSWPRPAPPPAGAAIDVGDGEGGRPPALVPKPVAPPTPSEAPPATAHVTTPAPAAKVATAPAPSAPKTTGSASARARGFVIIDIDSQPTGAVICFDGDPRIIATTRRAIQLPYADAAATFLIDMPGYQPGRFTVVGNRDARKVVKLQPMPPGQGRRPACSY